jgi:hypothetical protein
VVHELLGIAADAGDDRRDRLERFAAALSLFRAARWAEAAVAFRSLQRDWPEDGPTGFYVMLSEEYQATGPTSFIEGAVRIGEK